jgi:AraC-like DNA-binding protein
VKSETTTAQFSRWRTDHFFNIDFAFYSFTQHCFPRHFHDHFVIELVLKGADNFYCAGKNYTAYTNQLVLINPGEVHTGSTFAGAPLQYFSFYPDKKALNDVSDALDLPLPNDFNFRKCRQDSSGVTAKLQALYHSFISGSDTLLQEEIFFDCMHALLQCERKTPTKSNDNGDPRINKLTDFIATHFRENISLQQMAGLVNLNPFHLVRLFKKNTGLSPYDYLLIFRTERAKQLLHKGHQVQEAARQSGFYDTSHLNRSLRRITATSPKSFLLSKGQDRTILSR